MHSPPLYFILMQGVQASGKSTIARSIKDTNKIPCYSLRFPHETNFFIVSSDTIREHVYQKPLREIFKQLDQTLELTVWKTLFSQFTNFLQIGRDVILDTTSLQKGYRKKIINMIREDEQLQASQRPLIKILLRCDISLEQALQRNQAREVPVLDDILRNFYQTYQDIQERVDLEEIEQDWDLFLKINVEKNLT